MTINLRTFVLDLLSFFFLRIAVDALLGGQVNLESRYLLWTAALSILFALSFRKITTSLIARIADLLTRILQRWVDIELQAGEKQIMMDAASCLTITELVGGKLLLTNERLIFKSHNMNVQCFEESIPLWQIEEARAATSPHLRNPLLTLRLANDEVHHFVVAAPLVWMEMIGKQKEMNQ